MLREPLTPIDDDTEDAPWMVMGSPQWFATNRFFDALENELTLRQPPLYVTGMHPILYYPIPGGKQEKLAPDVLVARVPVAHLSSYDVEREGVPPAFVLEVISPESSERDLEIKPPRYERMGVEEFALFAPHMPDRQQLLDPPLQGYRRDPLTGEFAPWEADEDGRLYSKVLELFLVVRDGELRAQRPNGSLIPTHIEDTRARAAEMRVRAAESRAREVAEARADAAEEAAHQYATEVARLQTELERLRDADR